MVFTKLSKTLLLPIDNRLFSMLVMILVLINSNILTAQDCFDSESTSLNNGYPYNTNLSGSVPLTGLAGGVMTFSASLSGTASWVNGIQIQQNGTFGDYIYMQPNETDGSGNFATYTMSFDYPIENLSFISAGLNYNDQFTITAFLNGSPITVNATNFSNFNPSSGWNVNGNTVENPQAVGGTEIDANFFTTTLANVDSIVIVSTKSNTSNSTVTTAIRSFEMCYTILPIKLVSFDVERMGENSAMLEWKTSSELNNEYFQVEHSTDAQHFIPIADIPGARNSYNLLTYQFLHNNLKEGSQFYRLKQVDYDGTFEYSNIISIKINAKNDKNISIYPNPATSDISIQGIHQDKEMRIYDSTGQLVRSITSDQELDQIDLNISDLLPGLYIVKLDDSVVKLMKE